MRHHAIHSQIIRNTRKSFANHPQIIRKASAILYCQHINTQLSESQLQRPRSNTTPISKPNAMHQRTAIRTTTYTHKSYAIPQNHTQYSSIMRLMSKGIRFPAFKHGVGIETPHDVSPTARVVVVLANHPQIVRRSFADHSQIIRRSFADHSQIIRKSSTIHERTAIQTTTPRSNPTPSSAAGCAKHPG